MSTKWSNERGQWIGPAATDPYGVCFYTRRRVALPRGGCDVTLHVAAESIYRLFVDGQEVARGPARGTHTVNFYDTVTFETPSESREVWLAVAVYCPNFRSYKYHPARPAVMLWSEDGTIATDASWEVAVAPAFPPTPPIFTPQIGPVEWKDARAEPLGWNTGDADHLDWHRASILSDDERIMSKRLLPRDVPSLHTRRLQPTKVLLVAEVEAAPDIAIADVARHMSTESHAPPIEPLDFSRLCGQGRPPVTISPPADGGGVACIFDFEAAVNGGLEIDIDAPSGTIVDIGFQEAMCDGRLKLAFEAYRFSDRYTLREGRQLTGTDFAERGFRMVEVVFRDFDRPIRVYGVTGIDRRYPYVSRGTFTCDDPRWERLWSVCDETLRACTTDTLLDCPWRENALWINDLLVEAPTTMQAFGDPTVLRRSLLLAATQVRPDGLFPTVVPYGQVEGKSMLESCDSLTLTAGNLTLPLVLEDHLLYSGDRETVEAMTAMMPAMLDRFTSWEDASGRCVPPGHLWNFIDWCFRIDLNGQACCVLEWLRVLSHDALARLMKHLDPAADVASWTRQADEITGRIERDYWDSQQGCYIEGVNDEEGDPLITQLAQALAILSGRVSAGRRDALADMLMRDEGLAPELFMQHFVQRALVMSGRAEAAKAGLALLWFPIVESGSPTIWEMGVHQKGKDMFVGAGSLCHGFSTTPIDFMQRAVLGVRPTRPGFARCQFDPQAAGFNEAEGSVPTPHGDIHVRWRVIPNSDAQTILFDAHLTVPRGVEVDLSNGSTLSAGSHQLTLRSLRGPAQEAPRRDRVPRNYKEVDIAPKAASLP